MSSQICVFVGPLDEGISFARSLGFGLLSHSGASATTRPTVESVHTQTVVVHDEGGPDDPGLLMFESKGPECFDGEDTLGTSEASDGAVEDPADQVPLQLERASCLAFQAAAAGPSSCFLKMSNISASKVAFKVKLKGSKFYIVRPSSGILAPGQTRTVEISTIGSMMGSNEGFLVHSVVLAPEVSAFSRTDWHSLPAGHGVEQRLSVSCNDFS